MDNPKTAIELCAGYGGICLGLKRVIPSLRIVAYVEIEAFACANLVAKMESGHMDAAPVWTDIKTFDGKPFREKVDIVTGGYPCQPFSHAGKRKGTEDPRHLWHFIRTAINDIRPRYVFLENVEGHITLGLSTVISDMEEDDYETTWGIFSAAEVGAPHERKRVFILAHARSARFQRQGNGACGPSEKYTQFTCGSDDKWPARLGEKQHEWEPPRTTTFPSVRIANRHRRFLEEARAGECETQPQMGGDVDGDTYMLVQSTSRVDELRLLGNGVVPATAAKAWNVLKWSLTERSITGGPNKND